MCEREGVCMRERVCERGIEKSKTAATPAPQKWHPRIVANSFSFPWFRLFCCLLLSAAAATVEDFFAENLFRCFGSILSFDVFFLLMLIDVFVKKCLDFI